MERRGGKENTEVNNGPTPVVLVLFVSVMYSTDTDIKSGVKRWYDVDVNVYRSYSRLLEMERKWKARCSRLTLSAWPACISNLVESHQNITADRTQHAFFDFGVNCPF